MNKTALIIIVTGLILGVGIVLVNGSKKNGDSRIINSNNISVKEEQNTEIKDGIQYITIDAKGGYSPKVSSAKAGIPTKLIIKTNNTYDCSASLKISSVGYQKILPKTGEEIVDLGTPKAGEPVRGVCGMGMYSFLINFN